MKSNLLLINNAGNVRLLAKKLFLRFRFKHLVWIKDLISLLGSK